MSNDWRIAAATTAGIGKQVFIYLIGKRVVIL
jgi:hypothetical protein